MQAFFEMYGTLGKGTWHKARLSRAKLLSRQSIAGSGGGGGGGSGGDAGDLFAELSGVVIR